MRPLVLLVALAAAARAGEIAGDTRLGPGARRLAEPLRVVADGVVLDLAGAVLEGSAPGTDPDRLEGIGILVEGRRRVTIRGGRLSGFRCAILVRDSEEVLLEDVEVSGNFRQRLRSTPEREDPSDWLWPHENDGQQWRRSYGAGICIENGRKCTVRRCTGRRQQNGVLLDRCEGCLVVDCDFSFLSGWGLAMWRSSGNVVSRNRFDWCVRGYSHGVYARGQDSAGILVFEQCHRNVFVRNSATHGGDGFFLYAGNETVKRTGEGGCNDNLVVGNDFSHAVANGIEATFSTGNRFSGNRCDDCNYGIWAGYSLGSTFDRNLCRDDSIAGIAIEHGAGNRILGNTFARNPRGVWLWWDEDEDLLASAFGRAHPCRSEDYVIAGNAFDGDRTAIHLDRTSRVRHGGNGAATLVQEGTCSGIEVVDPADPPPAPPADAPGERDPFLPEGRPRGREHILVDEWGPLDPTEPGVFPATVAGSGECVFRVRGAAEGYAVEGLPEGIAAVRDGSLLRVRSERPGLHEFSGRVRVGGRAFDFGGTLLAARWRVRHWAWGDDPRDGAWPTAPPEAERETDRLDFVWGHGAPAPGAPADRFTTRAETTLDLPEGHYEFRTTSDDGVRVLVDGIPVQSDWTWHPPKENRTVLRLAAGRHGIAVEHFEIDGWAVLRLDLRRVPDPGGYAGFYQIDERFLAIRDRVPAMRDRALARIGEVLGERVEGEFEVGFEDGPWAYAADGRVVLGTEALVLGAYDPETTLVHELYHCLQRRRLGGGYASLPPWAREGAALYVAGQFEERARTLVASAEGPPGSLVAPLDEEGEDLRHYAAYAAAFDAAEARHGRTKAVALLKRLLETPDVRRAVGDALGEGFAAFAEAAREHARLRFEALDRDGGDAMREALRLLAREEWRGALDLLPRSGTFAVDAAFHRARALHALGRHREALDVLRAEFLPHRRLSVQLTPAILLELRLLRALNDPGFALAATRARADLRPFPVYAELEQLLN